MNYRKLRIAWSVAWGVVAVLLLMLWVRSYWWREVLLKPVSPTWTLVFGLADGGLLLRWNRGAIPIQTVPPPPLWRQYSIQSESKADRERNEAEIKRMGGAVSRPKFKFGFTSDGAMRVPYWLSFLACVFLATAPWITTVRRYSLRTLLIATTLVAIVLGVVVWMR